MKGQIFGPFILVIMICYIRFEIGNGILVLVEVPLSF
jgi:hypothetical protein